MESMASLRLNKIVFAGQFEKEFGTVLRSSAWPSFSFQGIEIGRSLKSVKEAQLLIVSQEANRGVSFIAQSVNIYWLHNSYVAKGHPAWIFEFFVNKSRDI